MNLATLTTGWIALGAPQILTLGVDRVIEPERVFVSSFVGVSYLPIGSSRSFQSAQMGGGIYFRLFKWLEFHNDISFQALAVNIPFKLVQDSAGNAPEASILFFGLYYTPSIELPWYTGNSVTLSSGIGVRFAAAGWGSVRARVSETASVADQKLVEALEPSSSRIAGFFSKLTIPSVTLLRVRWSL